MRPLSGSIQDILAHYLAMADGPRSTATGAGGAAPLPPGILSPARSSGAKLPLTRSVTIETTPTPGELSTAATVSAGGKAALLRRPMSLAVPSTSVASPVSPGVSGGGSTASGSGFDLESSSTVPRTSASRRTDQLEGRSYRFSHLSAAHTAGGSDIVLPSQQSHVSGIQRTRGRSISDFSSTAEQDSQSNSGLSGAAGGGTAFSPTSYTADDADIRDRTAQLASMALRGGRSGRNQQAGEASDSGFSVTSSGRGSGSAFGRNPAQEVLVGSQGPSNLAISLKQNVESYEQDDATPAAGTIFPDQHERVQSPRPMSTASSAASSAPQHHAWKSPRSAGGGGSTTGSAGGTGIPLTYTMSFGTSGLGPTDEEDEEVDDDEEDDEYDREYERQKQHQQQQQQQSRRPISGRSGALSPGPAVGFQRGAPSGVRRTSVGGGGAASNSGIALGAARNSSVSMMSSSQALGYGALVQAQAQEQQWEVSQGESGSEWSRRGSLPFSGSGDQGGAQKRRGSRAPQEQEDGENRHGDRNEEPSETSPLLAARAGGAHASSRPKRRHQSQGGLKKRFEDVAQWTQIVGNRARKLTWADVGSASAEPVRLIPAVVLGLLLNVLDGVSYGMITFPTSYPIFSDFGGDGVSMFFVTCILSQLVYSLGGSIFGGANGSMMIEVVPFFHIFVKTIIDEIGDENPQAVISTTIVAFALSSIFIGLAFLALGYLRLGKLIEFFPRHILVGCIGGVGVFLIETGLEVSGRLKAEDGFQWNLETLRYFTQSWHLVALWLPPLLLAILLRVITHHFHHPLIFPAYFMVIPMLFFLVTGAILREPLESLRQQGWVFDIGSAADAPFYRFYTYIDFRQTSFRALMATIPTQLALTFFGVLHVPLNVPALAISVGEDDTDVDRELIGHGISNLSAGLFFSGPNSLLVRPLPCFSKPG